MLFRSATNYSNYDEAEVGQLVDSIYRNADDEEPILVGLPVPSTSAIIPNVTAESADDSSSYGKLDYSDDEGYGAGFREEAEARRINDLTARYLTGSLTFSEFVLATCGDNEFKTQDDSDDEYRPHWKKKKNSSEAFCRKQN